LRPIYIPPKIWHLILSVANLAERSKLFTSKQSINPLKLFGMKKFNSKFYCICLLLLMMFSVQFSFASESKATQGIIIRKDDSVPPTTTKPNVGIIIRKDDSVPPTTTKPNVGIPVTTTVNV